MVGLGENALHTSESSETHVNICKGPLANHKSPVMPKYLNQPRVHISYIRERAILNATAPTLDNNSGLHQLSIIMSCRTPLPRSCIPLPQHMRGAAPLHLNSIHSFSPAMRTKNGVGQVENERNQLLHRTVSTSGRPPNSQ